tara:strand:+ start:304 stop:549 length:246 start_codon:yes stop_codon:yes gene_type:complete
MALKQTKAKIWSAFLRYVEREYKDVLDIMATSRIHSIKVMKKSEPQYYSNKTTEFLQIQAKDGKLEKIEEAHGTQRTDTTL